MKRAIVIVMDGCGAGEAPDAVAFGDSDHPSTIQHVWNAVGGFETPTLESLGFLKACGITTKHELYSAQYGRLQPLSQGGKDSVTGHWEMMGIVFDRRFPTFPNGFPQALIEPFEKAIGSKVLGNRPASGTQIIDELGDEHMRTGNPILYTSADSVFQVACHESIIPIERLYEICQIGRDLCIAPHDVQRVIARPFEGNPQDGFKRTERRKDFPLAPPNNICDEIGDVFGIGVVPELFSGRGFREIKRTQSNPEHAKMLDLALQSDAQFIWANFEDFDMLYGHRNDPVGFAQCLEAFDQTLAQLMQRLSEDDLLILTADHGNDPTSVSTDHAREFVPFVKVAKSLRPESLGDLSGFAHVGNSVKEWLQL